MQPLTLCDSQSTGPDFPGPASKGPIRRPSRDRNVNLNMTEPTKRRLFCEHSSSVRQPSPRARASTNLPALLVPKRRVVT